MTASIAANGFVVIDLPVRLTQDEAQQLHLAMASAIRRETVPRPAGDRLAAAIAGARELVRLLRTRNAAFGEDLFSDPGWSLLLDLLIAESSTRRVTVSSACCGSGAPSTTALRHLAGLEQRGWVERSASAEDQRVIHVRLSDAAIAAMVDLLAPA